jgi:hypothetical protein
MTLNIKKTVVVAGVRPSRLRGEERTAFLKKPAGPLGDSYPDSKAAPMNVSPHRQTYLLP